jgi:osmotically-inducible protein OsmY
MISVTDHALPSGGPRLRRVAGLGLVLLLSLGVAACRLDRHIDQQPAAERAPDRDERIAAAIEVELARDPQVPQQAISPRVTDGVVELTGTVGNLLSRRRTVRLVRCIRGVRAVVDRLQVEPAVPVADQQLAAAVREALQLEPAVAAARLKVSARAGSVTLRGTVDSPRTRVLAEKTAAGVSGVRAVDDRIEVATTAGRSDAEIRSEVMASLRFDALLDHRFIDVAVRDGRVELSGRVGSAAERRRAEADAWIRGAREVDVGRLQVTPWQDTPHRCLPAGGPPADRTIREAVELALIRDPRVDASGIELRVDDGVVHLTGRVGRLAAKRAAADDARNTVGVLRVDNLVQVRPESAERDAAVERRLERALQRAAGLEDYPIEVAVDRGVARLSGTVDAYHQKARADEVAAGVGGVVRLNNALAVRAERSPFVFDPYVDDWLVHGYGWRPSPPAARTRKAADDRALRQAVERKLRWNPFVDPAAIQITVAGGVVTLNGLVASPAARQSATADALAAGAGSVINRLELMTGTDEEEPAP